jgi:hypothetical protein
MMPREVVVAGIETGAARLVICTGAARRGTTAPAVNRSSPIAWLCCQQRFERERIGPSTPESRRGLRGGVKRTDPDALERGKKDAVL